MNIARYRIVSGAGFALGDFDPDDKSLIGADKDAARAALEALRARIEALQELLYADGRYGFLLVLQAMDTAGKDSTIRMVFDGVNPQGVRVAAFKAPTAEELAHDFLWRVHARAPGKGEMVIFNRSHYEDVLITRVNGWIDRRTWEARYRRIGEFERLLSDHGTCILKFFLHISSEEQKKRLIERRDDPAKQWKFNPNDLVTRRQWGDYMKAYEDAIAATASDHAPWFVVPANSKLQRNLIVSQAIVEALQRLDLRYPPAPPDIAKIVIA